MQNWAVFTGDIVRSGELSAGELQHVFDALADTAQAVAGWPDSHTIFARFRGDGWQMTLPARYALRAALAMRAAVRTQGKGFDSRIGIGLGAAQINGNDLASADGPAFIASGRALDGLARGPRMSAPQGPAPLRSALPLADVIAQSWTPKQAQVALALVAPSPPTQEALAASLARSRQMIQKQADAAGVSALVQGCDVYEAG